MKLSAVLRSLSLLVITPAAAADLSFIPQVPQLPPPAVLWSWTGLYIGGTAGWIGSVDGGAITNTGTDTGTAGLGTLIAKGIIPRVVNLPPSGFLGGGEVGYNLQFGTNWVFGIEADLSGEAGGSNSVAAVPAANPVFKGFGTVSVLFNRELNELGTVRGRLGYAIAPDQLWYVTAGSSYAATKTGVTFSCASCAPNPATQPGTSVQTSSNSVGWTVGAGVEWKFLPGWSTKVEYLYINAGTPRNSIAYTYGGNTSSLHSIYNETDNIVRIGVNYKLF